MHVFGIFNIIKSILLYLCGIIICCNQKPMKINYYFTSACVISFYIRFRIFSTYPFVVRLSMHLQNFDHILSFELVYNCSSFNMPAIHYFICRKTLIKGLIIGIPPYLASNKIIFLSFAIFNNSEP